MGEILDTTLKVSSGFSFLLLFLQSEFSHWHVALLILQTQSVKKPSTRAVSCQWCKQQDANQRPWHWQMANLHLVCQCPKNDHKVEYAFRHRYLVIDATKACSWSDPVSILPSSMLSATMPSSRVQIGHAQSTGWLHEGFTLVHVQKKDVITWKEQAGRKQVIVV